MERGGLPTKSNGPARQVTKSLTASDGSVSGSAMIIPFNHVGICVRLLLGLRGWSRTRNMDRSTDLRGPNAASSQTYKYRIGINLAVATRLENGIEPYRLS